MNEPDRPKALVLLNMGGPITLDEVEPYLQRLFSDKELISILPGGLGQRLFARWMSRLRAPSSMEKYRRIGGGSPLCIWTEKQARAICQKLPGCFTPFVAMRYSAPFAGDALASIRDAGIDEAVLLPMYPQYSSATSGSSIKDFTRAAALVHPTLKYSIVDSWYLANGYLDALAATVVEGLAAFPEEQRSKVPILFSAHSLPQRLVDRGDPYLNQTLRTVRGVVQRVGECPWHLGFQSRSGPLKWLGPPVREIMERLARQGHRALLMVPVSFVSDHLETLWDIDIEYRKIARDLGIRHFVRSPALNDRPDFIEALARLIIDHLEWMSR
ncbi:MAG: ferrochelatase [Desulfuromonadaceae bacterium]|nr:ferrochelatase [Desulfuromonadaceae bacterium]